MTPRATYSFRSSGGESISIFRLSVWYELGTVAGDSSPGEKFVNPTQKYAKTRADPVRTVEELAVRVVGAEAQQTLAQVY